MRIERVTVSSPQEVKEDAVQAALDLAINAACSLTGYPVREDSPFSHLAKAQVHERLIENLRPLFEPIAIEFEGSQVLAQAELLIAIDDSNPEVDTLAGFIDYKPRFFTASCASIGFIVVSPAYRGNGVMTAMLKAARDLYPVLALDCALDLVPMYQKFGFTPTDRQGCHVAMSTGQVEGKSWEPDVTALESRPLVRDAKARIRQLYGANTAQAYAELNNNLRDEQQKVANFIAALSA